MKLSLPVVIGSLILLLYYLKLLQLDSSQARKTIYFASILMPLSLLWPIPFNRRFISPLVRYLQGSGSAIDAEKSAAEFPSRSAFISLGSWIFCGLLFVIFSHVVLLTSPLHSLYIFIGFVSGGVAASFVHFLLLREAMEKLRIRIEAEIVRAPAQPRLSILMKLVLAFTMLISLSLLFFALISYSHLDEQTQQLQMKFSQHQLAAWSNALNHDPSVARYLPKDLTISKTWQPDAIQIRLANGEYLVEQKPNMEGVQFPFRWDDTLFMVLTVLIGGLIAYFAANDISRHLNEIREGTRWIAQGDFNHRLNIVSDDEVAELAASINQMAGELREKIEQLQKARDTAQEKSTQLAEANRELMQLDELKSNFLANISHELKAPLVSTKGYIDFILSAKLGPVNEKQIKGLTVSRDNLNHLSRLITSLLDFSKASSGLLKLHMESCSLPQMIESCVASAALEAKRKNKDLQFVSNIPHELPLIYADPDRVREVLMNLLLNAEKFTEKGFVKISVDVPSSKDEFLTVHITDNGIGIPKEHLTKIFHRFYQVDGSSTRKYGGTGLGLAIVREIVEAHRCKIHVESEEGIGSRFSFTLPVLRQTTDASHLRKLKVRPGKHHASKLVEVVEDDPNVGGIIKSLLEEEGFAVIQAHTGEDAIAIAREHRPDLITLDVYLPDVNGFELLSQLHSDEATTDIPIIVLSIVMDKEKGFRLGAADYLEKPIDANKLRESVLRISQAIDGIGDPMKIMIADDDENTVEFLKDLLSSEGYHVCCNLGGKEAVQKARTEKPDLILLDLVMPDLDGLDVLQQLKTEIDTRDIPVIVLTGKARMNDRDRSLMLGAQDFLMKPIELREIVDQVKKYFGALDA